MQNVIQRIFRVAHSVYNYLCLCVFEIWSIEHFLFRKFRIRLSFSFRRKFALKRIFEGWKLHQWTRIRSFTRCGINIRVFVRYSNIFHAQCCTINYSTCYVTSIFWQVHSNMDRREAISNARLFASWPC